VKKKNKEEWVKYCCCAVGSRDSSCSVWVCIHPTRYDF